MKKSNVLSVLFISAMVLPLVAFTWYYSEKEAEKEAVKSLIESAYLNGAHNKLNTQDMEKGFHPEFAMLYVKDNELGKLSVKDWVAKIEKKKAAAEFNAKDFEKTYKFKEIDVVGNVALAKVELYKDNQIIFTDYLSLYKFNEGWKIVSKVYNKHPEVQAKK